MSSHLTHNVWVGNVCAISAPPWLCCAVLSFQRVWLWVYFWLCVYACEVSWNDRMHHSLDDNDDDPQPQRGQADCQTLPSTIRLQWPQHTHKHTRVHAVVIVGIKMEDHSIFTAETVNYVKNEQYISVFFYCACVCASIFQVCLDADLTLFCSFFMHLHWMKVNIRVASFILSSYESKSWHTLVTIKNGVSVILVYSVFYCQQIPRP